MSYGRQYEVRMAAPRTSRIHCSRLYECGAHISCFGHHLSSQVDVMSDRCVHCIHNYGTQHYLDDGGSTFIQTLLHIYQITMYHTPEDIKLQSLPLESKHHLAMEILHIINQNRTMENVQRVSLNTCHKPFKHT